MPQMEHDTFGRHVLLDVWGADPETLNDLRQIRDIIKSAATVCGAHILKTAFQRFPVQGLSGVIVLAESHISVHTHPEYQYASFDVFTCGTSIDPRRASEYIVQRLGVQQYHQREFVRGRRTGIEEALAGDPVRLASG